MENKFTEMILEYLRKDVPESNIAESLTNAMNAAVKTYTKEMAAKETEVKAKENLNKALVDYIKVFYPDLEINEISKEDANAIFEAVDKLFEMDAFDKTFNKFAKLFF